MDLKTTATANRFILVAKNPITIMRLVRLMYFAQGWHLALKGAPIFPEPIQAWNNGPVIPSVYQYTKEFGGGEIDSYLMSGVQDIWLNKYERYVVDWVSSHYAKISRAGLVKAACLPGSPWAETYNGSFETIISNERMQKWFKARLSDRLNHPI